MLNLIRILKYISLNKTWYLKSYSDVRFSNIPPRKHFWEYGFYEGRHSNAPLVLLRIIFLLNCNKDLKNQFKRVYNNNFLNHNLFDLHIHYFPRAKYK